MSLFKLFCEVLQIKEMILQYAEIQIVLSPLGLDRTELVATPGDAASEQLAIEMYQLLAMEIHNFSKQISRLLGQKMGGAIQSNIGISEK